MLVAVVTSVRLGPVEPVGEPGGGSIPWQRVLYVDCATGTLELTLLADERRVRVLEAL